MQQTKEECAREKAGYGCSGLGVLRLPAAREFDGQYF